jgi:hypothetical protein
MCRPLSSSHWLGKRQGEELGKSFFRNLIMNQFDFDHDVDLDPADVDVEDVKAR